VKGSQGIELPGGGDRVDDFDTHLRAWLLLVAVVFAGLWVASPVDLILEVIPIVGPLDDIVVVALCLRYADGKCPRGPPGGLAGRAPADRTANGPAPLTPAHA